MNSHNNRVLITGHKGFIGFWVSYILKKNSWKIFGIDNNSSYGERLYNKSKIKFSGEGNFDICDTKKLTNFLKKNRINLIIHLAGQAIVPRAFDNPLETFKSNSLGTLSVLESINKCKNIKQNNLEQKIYHSIMQFFVKI